MDAWRDELQWEAYIANAWYRRLKALEEIHQGQWKARVKGQNQDKLERELLDEVQIRGGQDWEWLQILLLRFQAWLVVCQEYQEDDQNVGENYKVEEIDVCQEWKLNQELDYSERQADEEKRGH